MKAFTIRALLLLAAVLIVSEWVSAQHVRVVRVHRHPAKKVIVVKHVRVHQPKRVVVYHPIWAPNIVLTNRWVFFPRINVYWDNVRARYIYPRHGAWVFAATLPESYAYVNLRKEVRYEIEASDDVDDIYVENEAHQESYSND